MANGATRRNETGDNCFMKIYKKSELKYQDGFIITNDNEVVTVNPRVVDGLNRLEEEAQIFAWKKTDDKLKANIKESTPYKFESEYDTLSKINPCPETPLLEKRKEEEELSKLEMDKMKKYARANQVIKQNKEILLWLSSDIIVAGDSNCSYVRFDLLTLGNPLLLTPIKLVQALI